MLEVVQKHSEYDYNNFGQAKNQLLHRFDFFLPNTINTKYHGAKLHKGFVTYL